MYNEVGRREYPAPEIREAPRLGATVSPHLPTGFREKLNKVMHELPPHE
jgi:hypothetical protein